MRSLKLHCLIILLVLNVMTSKLLVQLFCWFYVWFGIIMVFDWHETYGLLKQTQSAECKTFAYFISINHLFTVRATTDVVTLGTGSIIKQ